MKTVEPKIIYLQVGEDADLNEFKKEDFETNAITWCWEKIYNNDIEYISKRFILSLIDDIIANERKQNYEIALTELKEKILETKK